MSAPGGERNLPTGDQWAIAHGQQTAVVTEVGATLRSYTLEGRELLAGFDETEWSHGSRGQVLAPWPNRLGDGSYEFDGVSGSAALDEPSRGNAIHGLVRWLPWRLESHAQNVVALACQLYPTPAYPFTLVLRVEYRLGRDGLVVSTVASNVGTQTLPFGIGFHPYLQPGSDKIDLAVLSLPARERLVLDDRGLPTGDVRPVMGTEYDFTDGRLIGPTRLDTPFTQMERDAEGLAWAMIDDPSGEHRLSLWMDGGFRYLMCYTGDTLDDPSERRRAVALEPMTCPPDAFRSGRDLVVLEPGQSWEASWGLTALRPSLEPDQEE